MSSSSVDLQNIFLAPPPLPMSVSVPSGMGYYCKYCSRHFRFKDLYDQHNVTCEFFYRKRRVRERENETHEALPTQQEQYKLIQYLALQVTRQQKEIDRLKGSVLQRKRKVILDWLRGSSAPIPTLTFQEWIRTIPVTFDHLEPVFQGDLTDGMKQCLLGYLATVNGVLPICAFNQKAGTIYIWSSSGSGETDPSSPPSWRLLDSEEFERWMNRLAHRFLQEYIKWQMANSEKIHSTEEEQEKNIQSMRKINGLGKAHEDRRRSDLRKWLYSALARDFLQCVDYDFV